MELRFLRAVDERERKDGEGESWKKREGGEERKVEHLNARCT